MKRSLPAILAVLLSAVVVPGLADACQVCFGDPNSPMTKGAQAGVWVLLGIVLAVEAAFGVFFFVYLRKRSRFYPDGSLRPALRLIKN